MRVGVHLPVMKHYRVTSTGRRIAAEARRRPEPDVARLVALVLHLADELRAKELDDRQRQLSRTREGQHTTLDAVGGVRRQS